VTKRVYARKSSSNIFADLGLPDAEERLLKSGLVLELSRLVKERDLTQVKAARLVGTSQPDLSRLLRGDFDDYSAERLMKMLTAFDPDVEIVVRPLRKIGQRGRTIFKPVAA
jgi:predicted XRE-type DNA-binding protein